MIVVGIGKLTCVSRDLILPEKLCGERMLCFHQRSRFIAGPLTASLGDIHYTLAARQKIDASLTSEG
jgi:hypothetical protein